MSSPRCSTVTSSSSPWGRTTSTTVSSVSAVVIARSPERSSTYIETGSGVENVRCMVGLLRQGVLDSRAGVAGRLVLC